MSSSAATHPRSSGSRHHRGSSGKRRSRSRSRERHHNRSRRSVSAASPARRSAASSVSSAGSSPRDSQSRRTKGSKYSRERKTDHTKANKQKRKKDSKKKKRKKSTAKEKNGEKVEAVPGDLSGRHTSGRELTSAKEEPLPSENLQQQSTEGPEPTAMAEQKQQGEPENPVSESQRGEAGDCLRQEQPQQFSCAGPISLCQVLLVSEATRLRIAEGKSGDAELHRNDPVIARTDAGGGVSGGGIGTFGRPKADGPAPAAIEASVGAGGDGEVRKVTLKPKLRSPDRGNRDDQRQRERRRRSPDNNRQGRAKRSRRRSDSGSSGSSNSSNVGLIRGRGRLIIDKDRLRRRAIENTVMGLSERCPEKLADMPCFKALGVRVSELEKICRKLTAASTELQASRLQQQQQQVHTEGSNAKDKGGFSTIHSGGASGGGGGSAGSVRHPFQLRPDSATAVTGSGGASVSRFASAASQQKELLAAFPVSSGVLHNQQGEEAAVTLPTSSSEAVEVARSPVVPAVGVGYGDWATAKVAAPAPPQPQPQQRTRSPQAWVNTHQFLNAQPIMDGVGHRLLQKMGWRWGQGLGKRNEGPIEPLAIGFKADRKGLASHEDRPAAPIKQFPGGKGVKKKAKSSAASAAAGLASSLGAVAAAAGASLEQLHGKHPISVLLETAKRMRLPDPQFRLVHESGPPHDRCFVFCARVGGTEFQPTRPSKNKKEAKAAAAAVALQHLGIVPRT